MKFETKQRENYSSVFFSLKIPFVEKTFRIYFQLYNSPNTWVHGYSARTEQGRYVLFLDYDNLDYFAICEELCFLQKQYSLSDFYIFKSPDKKDSFHAICLDTFPIFEAYSILKQTSSDNAFIEAVKLLRSREWILRFDKKGERAAPKYFGFLPNISNRIKSSAHAMFLEELGVPVSENGVWDNCKRLTLVDYNTANRTEALKDV